MENKIIWLDNYKTGNPIIDRQHEKLFELANQVIDPNNDPQKTHHNLIALQHYLKRHFDEEEQIMQQCNGEDYAEHVAEHEKLLRKLDENGTEIITNELSIDEIVRRMQNWLFDHFLKKDMPLWKYFHNEIANE